MVKQIIALWACLAATVCLASTFKCPLREELAPCSCYGYSVYCEEKGTDARQVERALRSLRGRTFLTLHLSEADLGELRFSAFRDLQFRTLEVSHSKLRNLTDTGEPGLERLREHLEVIEITYSIQDDFRLNISSFKNLQRLDLSNNDFLKAEKAWFRDTPSSLLALTLYDNDIETLEEGAFFRMTQLERLVLASNRISDIKRNMFPGPGNNLHTLFMDYNAISTIPEDFFTDMDALRNLHLRFNRLVVLPRGMWSTGWGTLKFLDLYGNRLQCDDGIEWMFYERGPDNLSAKCYLPRELRGKNLQALIDENSEGGKQTQLRPGSG